MAVDERTALDRGPTAGHAIRSTVGRSRARAGAPRGPPRPRVPGSSMPRASARVGRTRSVDVDMDGTDAGNEQPRGGMPAESTKGR
jgi:hypothetical protein